MNEGNWQAVAAQAHDAGGALAQPLASPGAGTAPTAQHYWQELGRVWSRWSEDWQHWAAQGYGNPQPGAPDRRFAGPEWQTPYFALLRDQYLALCRYWEDAVEAAELAPRDKARLRFSVRQWLDAVAPTNFPATNPEAIKLALATDGDSLRKGAENLAADFARGRVSMTDEAAFAVGRNLAITPGAVVYRNDLIELIQYAPSTATVHARPLLVVPPCINKFYILDLQPDNSFVRYAVGEGHTVFMISWRNVPPELGSLTWDDYLEQGVLQALTVVNAIAGTKSCNALGFCVGGAMLACALAVLASRGETPVASATFLATMLDYADPGQIGVYIDDAALAAREPALAAGERVNGSELAGAFASLRANELVWAFVVNNYLKGRTPPAFDLLYWNGDGANLPGPMYAWYLRTCYLENALREPGRVTALGVPVDLGRIALPAYVLATREDHIVPWRSAYRSVNLFGGDAEFVLGGSGHIAGVINPAAKNRREYWIDGLQGGDADEWLASAEEVRGSWWPHWRAWLHRQGGVMRPAPDRAGSNDYPPLAAAPGRYVLEKA